MSEYIKDSGLKTGNFDAGSTPGTQTYSRHEIVLQEFTNFSYLLYYFKYKHLTFWRTEDPLYSCFKLGRD